MIKFKDLEFKTDEFISRARVSFDNGYQASIVIGPYSYGGSEGLYEIGILDDKGELTYSTPITDDVIGHLTKEGVEEVLQKISELPSILDMPEELEKQFWSEQPPNPFATEEDLKKLEDKNIDQGYYEGDYFA